MTPLLFVTAVMVFAEGAPLTTHNPQDLELLLDRFLEQLYQQVHDGGQGGQDIYDQMQGDQPDNNVQQDVSKILSVNFSDNINMSDYHRTSRERHRDADSDDRAKINWIQILKENILRQVGRSNMTLTKGTNNQIAMNISMVPEFFNSTVLEDDQITEKIRSYYPSCEVPSNIEQEVWQDDNIMNLYFNNFDHSSDEKALSIATATLRLYRIPNENSTKVGGKVPDCDSSSTSDEDRLLRVSIYWYTRSVRKKKVKRHLSDSKVISENARWVELSVKPAARAWSRGRNLGLGVLVEDQEQNVLKASQFFKGALCMVGASTPKPIPTIIIDAVRETDPLNQRIHSLLGRNTTPSISSDVSMLPTIDICTLEFPENYSQPPSHIANLRINACNLKKSHDHAQLLAERDRFERLATLPELLSSRHIRHQRQHLKLNDVDPRSLIINKKKISTNEELQAVKLNITVDR